MLLARASKKAGFSSHDAVPPKTPRKKVASRRLAPFFRPSEIVTTRIAESEAMPEAG
jgi:hypothetical protein